MEAEEALKEIQVNVELREDGVWLQRQNLEGEWKGIWKKVKRLLKGKPENCKLKKKTMTKRCKVKCMKN